MQPQGGFSVLHVLGNLEIPYYLHKLLILPLIWGIFLLLLIVYIYCLISKSHCFQAEEIVNLKKQVSEGVKSLEETHINRADTINRLTRSLEESQTQCRVLLEAG